MTTNKDINTQRSRRWKYGINLVMLVVIAIVITGLLGYLTTRYSQRVDLSSSGSNSLSERSKKLVAQLGDQSYEFVSTFRPGSYDTQGRDRYQQVNDLLANYVRAGKKITLGTPEGLDTRISERFSAETKPYENIITEYPPVFEELEKFLKNEAASFGLLSQQKGLSAADQRQVQAIQGIFDSSFAEDLKRTREAVRKETESTVPDWSRAVGTIKSRLEDIVEQLKSFSQTDLAQLAPAVQKHVKENAEAYKKIIADADALKAKIDALAPLKSDDVFNAISTDSIVILGPTTAKVVNSSDIYKVQPDPSGLSDQPQVSFEGEQAISTALLAMSQPDKPKVVFIGSSPQMIGREGPYSAFAETLQKANFDTLEWSPPSPMQQPRPGTPPPQPEPPAIGKGVTWIVLPPDPPNQQMMMMGMPPPDAGEIIGRIEQHLAEGGSVLFLAEASNPMMAMMGGGQGYAYEPILKQFGIEVEDKYTIVQAYPAEGGKTQAYPQFTVDKFPAHPITDPIQSLMTVFAGQMSQFGAMGGATPVVIDKNKPGDVTANVIVETPKGDTIWAESNVTPTATYSPDSDLASPLSLAVAAERKLAPSTAPATAPATQSQATSQRIVVIGNRLMATNGALQAGRPAVRGNTLVYVTQFPGNSELLLNSVYWLNNYENMIAVSPQATAALRIKALSPVAETTLRTASILVPPALAILAGVIVFFVRRKA